MESKIPVKEIMTREVVTAFGNINAQDASKKMLEENVGSLVILDKKNKPNGILTERDLVRKVISKNKEPKSVKAEDIMTKPLVTVLPEIGLNEAVRKMRDLEIKKLPVVDNGELKGIITESDVLTVSPAFNEIAHELAQINQRGGSNRGEEWAETGICENCSSYSNDLKAVSGNLLCEQCREELELGD